MSNQIDANDLLAAGASAPFIKYYLAAKEAGERTLAVCHIESDLRSLEDVAENPGAGGGFFESLWNDEPRAPHNRENPYGADGTNKRLLQKAGVYPEPVEA